MDGGIIMWLYFNLSPIYLFHHLPLKIDTVALCQLVSWAAVFVRYASRKRQHDCKRFLPL